MADLEEALKLSPDEFKAKFGRDKPRPENEVIFHCKMGGRAGRASLLAESLGFVKYVDVDILEDSNVNFIFNF